MGDKDLNIVLTKPKNVDYEIFIFEKYVGLMNYLKAMKESKHTLEQDLDNLSRNEMTYQQKFATVYRCEKKKIIRSNIDLAQKVLSVLYQVKERP